MKKKSTQWLSLIGLVLLVMAFTLTGCSNKDDAVVNVTLLQTTDMHNAASGVGSFNAYTPMDTSDNDSVTGGWARLAAKIKAIRTAKKNSGSVVLLVDSGDYNMGTVYDLLWNTDPAPLRFIQSVSYDLITLGNHEFDYGPKKLATMVNRARAAAGGFSVPIIATNTVFDGVNGTDDDDLEDLRTAGVIINDYYVKRYSNGLKIGVIGLMGQTADEYSPNAPPVTFKSDYTDETVKAFIQAKVNALRNTEGVHMVIALSHSGITGPNTETPAGDDITLAQNITGIDIIASGHDHAKTNAVVPVANGNHTTYIICAGENGTNLAQLDIAVNLTAKKLNSTPTLTNHAINDTIAGDSQMDFLVQTMNTTINGMLTSLGTTLSSVVATSSLALGDPGGAMEFGLGNLLADAIRYIGTESGTMTFGAFANGCIRSPLAKDQVISFADLFAVTPLGITTDDTQTPLLPGYPLLKVYLNGDEIWGMCKFDATIMAFQAYIAYFQSLSGIKYSYTGTAINDVQAYAWNDYTCTGQTTPIPKGTATLYPVIIDKYVMDMLLTEEVQNLLALFVQVSIQPKLADGTIIDKTNLMSARLDRDSATTGIQELSAWMATLAFFRDAAGLNGTIPTIPYDLSTKRVIAQ